VPPDAEGHHGASLRRRRLGGGAASTPDASSGSSGDRLPSLLAVLDFDGTITVDDCLEVVLRRHLPADGWGARETVPRTATAPLTTIRDALAHVQLDADRLVAELADAAVLRHGFAAFLTSLVASGGRAAVVSLGPREGIERVWRRDGLPLVDILASELEHTGRALSLAPSGQLGSCARCGPGGCKGNALRALRRSGELVAVFGDGQADLCLAEQADVVFARGRLRRLCDKHGIQHFALRDFDIAWRRLITCWRAAPASAARG
jgi:2-hydroxy-3-keto-5-methylthiopentenyl-1-phosphate phosphatase